MIVVIIIVGLVINLPAYIYAGVVDEEIKVHEPRGISIIIPDDTGIEAFYFWANINENFTSTNRGKIRLGTIQPVDGKWIIHDQDLELKNGDVINYVLFTKRHSVIERFDNRRFIVSGLQKSEVPATPSSTTGSAKPTEHSNTTPENSDLSQRIITGLSTATPSLKPSKDEFPKLTTSPEKVILQGPDTKDVKGVVGASSSNSLSTRTPENFSTTSRSTIHRDSNAEIGAIASGIVSKTPAVHTTASAPPTPQSSHQLPTSMDASSDDCSHRIIINTDDFTLDFYGNTDMNKINPKMLAKLVVNGCDVKYETAEEEPNTVDFHISK